MGGGGRDASRDVREAAVGTIHFGSVTSNKKISIIVAILVTLHYGNPGRHSRGLLKDC